MEREALFKEIELFSSETHGSSDYYKDNMFVAGGPSVSYAPLRHLRKKITNLESFEGLLKDGFLIDSYDFLGSRNFQNWYEKQFSRKLNRRVAKKIFIAYVPNNRAIFDSIESINKGYEILREQNILINSKNLPVQLGEWYGKCIFGIRQMKSTSQRGFDFQMGEKRIEIKISWSDQFLPKGVKVRRPLVELSDYCVIMYLANNFMIREICFLDSEFILRKLSGKGHTIFLKESDISGYFFSRSSRHIDKVVNSTALLKYSSPILAAKIAEYFQ